MDRWQMTPAFGIAWDVARDRRLPHGDHIEMSGLRVAAILFYGVDTDGCLSLNRRLVWPGLRVQPNDTHSSLRHDFALDASPRIAAGGRPLPPETPRRVTIDGTLRIESTTAAGIELVRTLFPSAEHPVLVERWTLRNATDRAQTLEIEPLRRADYVRGTESLHVIEASSDAPTRVCLEPGGTCGFSLTFGARRLDHAAVEVDAAGEETRRRRAVDGWTQALRFESPDPVLGRAFDFAKVRAAESIFATRKGLMHCPGGEAYYAAVWCNDEAEYANPFFPFLGDEAANDAAINSYRLYMPFMGPNYERIPSSIIAEGASYWDGAGDRGDAAMYAYGASVFALARGNRAVAQELWPAIEWCLEYCRRQTTPEGVIASDADELEGRFSHGRLNLATSSLTYGGLCAAARLAAALGKQDAADEYRARADALALAIDAFFGANVQGFETYRYHDGLDVLRAWICLPVAMGIGTRAQATLDALFSPKMWTDDGLATESGGTTFWDRSTLYGLRAAFMAGRTGEALGRFTALSRRRLLGDHVPYPVEAWPEGDQRHLSAEGALYCRVVLEGLFGIVPTGFSSFRCLPRLPDGWNGMALRSVRAFEREFDIVVRRVPRGCALEVRVWREPAFETVCATGEAVEITLP